jgi:YidC/Oxa1 family membrane protein insertase
MRSVSRADLLRLGLLLAVAVVVAACSGQPLASGQTAAPTPVPTDAVPLHPANPDNPLGLFAWLFTPIYQALLMLMFAVRLITPDIGVAIIVTTLIVRTALVPLMRRSMVATRQMQAIQPELQEIQRRYKSDRVKAQQAQAELMKERGISQAGCLSMLLPMLLILPMYQVVREGLSHPDPTQMLSLFGIQIVPLTCDPIHLVDKTACIDGTIPWLGGLHATSFPTIPLPVIGFPLSIFALVYTIMQLIASRLALPAHKPGQALDQNARTQRTMALWLPLITLLYANVIPLGVFLYLIVSTAYQMVQQFLTTGWGGMFPIFGWMPSFAVDHRPRFPVAVPSAPTSSSRAAGAPARSTTPEQSSIERAASAQATIRQRGRQGRRGRRR